MTPKFRFKILQHQVIFDDATKQRRTDYIRSLPDGEYEDIVRPEIKWDTVAMQKYFHGPVRKFFVDGYRHYGINKTRDEVKKELKEKYGPKEEKEYELPSGKIVKKWVLKSTSEYNFEEYKELLVGANLTAIDEFEQELPPSDEVE